MVTVGWVLSGFQSLRADGPGDSPLVTDPACGEGMWGDKEKRSLEKVTHLLSPGARMQQVIELGGLTTRLVNSENTLASHTQSPEGEIPAEVSRGAAVVSHNKGSPALRLNLWDVTGLTLPPTATGPLIVASPDSTDTPDSSRSNFYLPSKDLHGGVSRLYILCQGWKI